MEIQIVPDGNVTLVHFTGILKKPDARRIADQLEALGGSGCTELILNCGNLAAVAYDSVAVLVSALDRLRHQRVKTSVVGASPVVHKALQAGGLGRVADLKGAVGPATP